MLNPSEISDILKQQLANVNSQVKFEEVGTVLEVGDGVAHVYGLENVKANELVEFENGVKGVALNLEESNVGVVLLNNVNKVTENMSVRRTGDIASIPVGEGLLGRVINILGEPIDGKGPIEGDKILLPLERKAPGVIFRQPVNQPLQTGIKAVDAMIPIGRGQRELIIGDRQIGKTAIAIDTIINQRENYLAGKPVFCMDIAIAGALGYGAIPLNQVTAQQANHRIIFNTVPAMVLPEAQLKLCRRDCLKIDLASVPGIAGDDIITARGLPGKMVPESAGHLIAKTILELSTRKEVSS